MSQSHLTAQVHSSEKRNGKLYVNGQEKSQSHLTAQVHSSKMFSNRGFLVQSRNPT